MYTNNQFGISDTAESDSANNIHNLETIKVEIQKRQADSDRAYLEIGQLLLEVKRIKPHGKWIPWVQDNTELSICKAQRLMRVATWIDKNEAPVPPLDFTKAYVLSRLSKRETADFLKRHQCVIGGTHEKTIEKMTKRELETAVRDYLKSQNRKSAPVQVPQQAKACASPEKDLFDRFERVRNDVTELASIVENDPERYDAFAAELCELCQSVVQQLSPEDLENA